MALDKCEVCLKILKDCKCRSTPADFIESQPQEVIDKTIKTIKEWKKK